MAVFPVSNVRPLVACGWLLIAPSLAAAQAVSSPPAVPGASVPAASAESSQAPAVLSPTPVAPAASPQAASPQAAAGEELPDPFATDVSPEEPESMGWTLVRTLLLLAAVVASIYLTLNVGLRRLMGLQGVPVGRPSVVAVLERLPLDQRRTLFVLKAADEYLLVGGGEGGLQLLSKLDTEAVERIRAERPQTAPIALSPFLQKLLSRRTGSTPPRS
ncbi:flagellar biosynthetic protein FliO [Stigmatella sp. ncwal1]|uniref:Flagellar biosynthetic protein FliO n=1 Tax=Stigmatella ashevillensis TaxID=2995309 RepID=A0ABT5DNH6_9BACT|nr:flagellar biosynthetic protein FliO [Stigmatella ashevillena]MDC0714710.1 flagellar biosynthetic protein FliO [Stigmatella ashevillena]